MPYISVATVTIILVAHFYLSQHRQRDAQLIIISACIGAFIDSLQGLAGIFSFNGSWHSPLWLVCLWMAFASTLYYSLAWLGKRYIVAAVFGAIGGPLSYYAGSKFNALTLNDELAISLISVSIVWAIITPLLFLLANHLPVKVIKPQPVP